MLPPSVAIATPLSLPGL